MSVTIGAPAGEPTQKDLVFPPLDETLPHKVSDLSDFPKPPETVTSIVVSFAHGPTVNVFFEVVLPETSGSEPGELVTTIYVYYVDKNLIEKPKIVPAASHAWIVEFVIALNGLYRKYASGDVSEIFVGPSESTKTYKKELEAWMWNYDYSALGKENAPARTSAGRTSTQSWEVRR